MTLPERTATESSTGSNADTAQAPDPAKQALTIISHAETNDAIDAGLVQPFGRTIAYAVRYQDHWWIHYERGWIQADPQLAALLDADRTRLAAQDAIIARNAAAALDPGNQQEPR